MLDDTPPGAAGYCITLSFSAVSMRRWRRGTRAAARHGFQRLEEHSRPVKGLDTSSPFPAAGPLAKFPLQAFGDIRVSGLCHGEEACEIFLAVCHRDVGPSCGAQKKNMWPAHNRPVRGLGHCIYDVVHVGELELPVAGAAMRPMRRPLRDIRPGVPTPAKAHTYIRVILRRERGTESRAQESSTDVPPLGNLFASTE